MVKKQDGFKSLQGIKMNLLACEQAPSEVWKKHSASFVRGVTLFARRMFFSDLAGSLFAGYEFTHWRIYISSACHAVSNPNQDVTYTDSKSQNLADANQRDTVPIGFQT